MTDVENLAIAELKHGQVLDFGSITLSEDEIMDYARLFDPLPFHIDKKIALESPFKGLISSGPQRPILSATVRSRDLHCLRLSQTPILA